MFSDKTMKAEKHIFSFFVSELCISNSSISIIEKEFLHRIMNVLKFEKGEVCILYSHKEFFKCELKLIDSKKAIFEILEKNLIFVPKPCITFFLPLVHKAQMEEMFYTAAQLAVNTIQVVRYDRSHSSWGNSKDFERAQKTMISASEQAKAFSLPVLAKNIISYKDAIKNVKDGIIVDYNGKKLQEIASDIILQNSFSVIIGPEGGFSDSEYRLSIESTIAMMKLTPTILRSADAASLVLGIIRSLC